MTTVRERPAAPAQTGPRAAARLIASRRFGPYFAGNALSASGTWFQNLAAAILVYRLTGSAFLLGVLNFAQFLPTLVLAPWAGAAADRFDRRRLILVTQLVSTAIAAALAAVTWAGEATAAVVIAASLALGVVTAFSAPAAQALIGSLVEPHELATAVGLNSMTFNVARALGPTVAAAAIATLGIAAAFAINACSYLALALGIAVVRPRRSAAARRTRFRDSLKLLRVDRRLAIALAVVAVVGFGSDPVNTLSPAFAHAFGRPDTDAGFVVGAFGAGAVTAAFVLAGGISRTRRRAAARLGLLGGGIVLFSVSPSLFVALPFLFVAGFGYLAANTSATARLQLGVDETQRGRMMALWTVAFLGLRPFASIVDGAIAGSFGVRVAGIALALPALTAAALFVIYARQGTDVAREAPFRSRA